MKLVKLLREKDYWFKKVQLLSAQDTKIFGEIGLFWAALLFLIYFLLEGFTEVLLLSLQLGVPIFFTKFTAYRFSISCCLPDEDMILALSLKDSPTTF